MTTAAGYTPSNMRMATVANIACRKRITGSVAALHHHYHTHEAGALLLRRRRRRRMEARLLWRTMLPMSTKAGKWFITLVVTQGYRKEEQRPFLPVVSTPPKSPPKFKVQVRWQEEKKVETRETKAEVAVIATLTQQPI
jgi:hypothetical protein